MDDDDDYEEGDNEDEETGDQYYWVSESGMSVEQETVTYDDDNPVPAQEYRYPEHSSTFDCRQQHQNRHRHSSRMQRWGRALLRFLFNF